jgi:DNA-binding PadR family transcriptional regulator
LPDFGGFSEPGLLVLVSLAAGAKHGYAIQQDIEALTNERLGPGTLYGAIKRLEEQGLIEALPPEDRRRPYQLTTAGRQRLRTALERARSVTSVGLRRLAVA